MHESDARPIWKKPQFGVIAVLCAALLRPVAAAELHLSSQPYAYTVIDQDVRSALHEFGANLGLRITLSDAVQGRIRGRLPALAPRDFLDRLSAMFGLDWYYDGYVIAVTAQSESKTQLISAPGLGFRKLKTSLDALGISDDRFVARPLTADSAMLLVAGPPRYVELVGQTAETLSAEATGQKPVSRVLATQAEPSQAGAPPRPTSLMFYRGGQGQRVTFGDTP